MNKKRLRLAARAKLEAGHFSRWMLKKGNGSFHLASYETYDAAERDACEKALCDCTPVPVVIAEA